MAFSGGQGFPAGMGIIASHVCGALVRLGVPDALDDDGTPVGTLAGRVSVREDLLIRLLRAAAAVGILVESGSEPGRFAPTGSGKAIRRDHPSALYSLYRLFTEPAFLSSWPGLEQQLRTGEVAFDVANGTSFFAHLAENPELSELFNVSMRGWTMRMVGPVVEHFDFGRFGTVVDVGGGDGSMLAAVLAANPGVRGVVYDTPAGVAQTAATLAAAGVDDRCTVEAGDFFTSVPAGGDAYLLKGVVHDWDDERAATVLGHCRDALPDGGRILVVDSVLPETVGPDTPAAPYLLDISIMLNFGGRERTRSELEALLRATGLEPAGVTPIPSEAAYCVLEAARR